MIDEDKLNGLFKAADCGQKLSVKDGVFYVHGMRSQAAEGGGDDSK